MCLYIKRENIEYHTRDDLTSTTIDYECLLFEVHSSSRNIVCSIIYRHPRGNLDAFTSYYMDVIDKISREGKLCISMGDFNLNLVNVDNHTDTDEFVNTTATYCFQPCIIKPTRITDHSNR